MQRLYPCLHSLVRVGSPTQGVPRKAAHSPGHPFRQLFRQIQLFLYPLLGPVQVHHLVNQALQQCHQVAVEEAAAAGDQLLQHQRPPTLELRRV